MPLHDWLLTLLITGIGWMVLGFDRPATPESLLWHGVGTFILLCAGYYAGVARTAWRILREAQRLMKCEHNRGTRSFRDGTESCDECSEVLIEGGEGD